MAYNRSQKFFNTFGDIYDYKEYEKFSRELLPQMLDKARKRASKEIQHFLTDSEFLHDLIHSNTANTVGITVYTHSKSFVMLVSVDPILYSVWGTEYDFTTNNKNMAVEGVTEKEALSDYVKLYASEILRCSANKQRILEMNSISDFYDKGLVDKDKNLMTRVEAITKFNRSLVSVNGRYYKYFNSFGE